MKQVKAVTWVGAGVLAGVLATVSLQSIARGSRADVPLEEMQRFARVFESIKSSYVEPVDEKKLITDAIKGMVTGFRDASKGTAIAQLIAEGWLQEIEVPAAIRANNSRKAFLVRLSAAEHEAWQRTGVIPPNKQIIPRSWQKAPPTSARRPRCRPRSWAGS